MHMAPYAPMISSKWEREEAPLHSVKVSRFIQVEVLDSRPICAQPITYLQQCGHFAAALEAKEWDKRKKDEDNLSSVI